MIQRIQSVYLALVAVLSILGLCLPLAQYFVGTTMVASFNHFVYMPTKGYDAVGSFSLAPLAFGVLLIIVVLLTLVSIMLFRFRMRQLRLTIFSTLMLVGYVLFYAFLAWKFQLQLAEINAEVQYHLCFAAILPVVSIILNCLAIHGIRKDEALVRSLDRLR
ncbi:MAG: DUF4293 domain-containing protein [Bacteroidaceae bacterium]|nr:DUF4293 domain-containing protein [Bacteroidaceae bacterium]